MCGRYRLTAKERYLRDHFGLDDDPQWEPRWNIAPTQQVAVVRQRPKQPGRGFSQMRWGLIPSWAKDGSIASRTIDAMSETAAEKPAFKEALRQRRCLIPVHHTVCHAIHTATDVIRVGQDSVSPEGVGA